MRMTLSPFHQVTWFTLLFCGCTYRGLEASITDACEVEDHDVGEFLRLCSSKDKPDIKEPDEKNITCLLYPTNVLNCSWSFPSLEKEAWITVKISVCDGRKTVQTLDSEERVGSRSSRIERRVGSSNNQTEEIDVIVYFNISLPDQWAVYYYKYDFHKLEVLLPPPNVTGSFKDKSLLVSWGRPSCWTDCSSDCLNYELRLGDQESPKYLEKQESYTERNVDLTQSYSVTIRTKISSSCSGSHHWSDWSEPVTVQASESPYKLNTMVIAAISLGIPMILLALLLLVRHQSVSKLLFPPIPCPPPKYLHVLQNNDPFVYPDLMAKQDEEITLVFYTEEEKTHKL